MLKIKIFSLVIIMCFALSACTNPPIAFDKQDFAMGTIISQHIFGDKAKLAADEVMQKIKYLEDNLTINKPGGEINKLNANAGNGKWIKLDKEIIYVLGKAKDFGAKSNGAFDVTVGPLVKAWGIFTDKFRIPPASELTALKKLLNLNNLELDVPNSAARLTQKGQIVDLGGIAKGYSGDVAKEIYQKNGITSAYISLGGNIVAVGGKPDGSNWSVGIQNPRAENGKYLGIVSVKNKSIVTSGDYERFKIVNGIRYHHILDTKTGAPARSGLISTSIISDLSIDGDALSTATFVLGLDKAMALIESLPGVEAIFVTDTKQVYTTSGLKGIFTFDDATKEFTYVEKR